MKSPLLKFTFLLIVLAGGLCACQDDKDDLFMEISPQSQSQVIEREIDGITFTFCLLNEQGEPATVFKEGENFSFYFSVTNKRNEKVFYVPEIVRSNDDSFCRIFNNDNQDFGKPYIGGAIDKIGVAAYMLDVNGSCEFKQPWNDERDNWQWEYTHFESTHRDVLKQGDYYTEIKHKFEFIQEDGQTKFYTELVNFKINFQIR